MSYRRPPSPAKDIGLTDALTRARSLAARDKPDALYELQSEVSRLATSRRREDPEYLARMAMGYAAARTKIHAPPRFAEALT